MKKICFLTAFACLSLGAMAQKVLPQIKQGTNIALDIEFHGQSIPVDIAMTSLGDTIKMAWQAAGAGGVYAMKASSLESGTKFSTQQPQPDAVTTMNNDETFIVISKSAYQSLIKNKTFMYSGVTYTAKNNPDGFKMNGQPIDALYIATADGKTSMWILNNPSYPLVLQMKGDPAGVDYTLTSIK